MLALLCCCSSVPALLMLHILPPEAEAKQAAARGVAGARPYSLEEATGEATGSSCNRRIGAPGGGSN
eukprot:11840544-Alexandrium_andersonii.AAC.1